MMTLGRYQHSKDVCPFIAYFEIETVFHNLIFWQFLFISPIAPNKNNRQI